MLAEKSARAASSEEVLSGVQLWELTAGLGMVPKWVSLIGILAISAAITASGSWVLDYLSK
jgi:hypothetical protein